MRLGGAAVTGGEFPWSCTVRRSTRARNVRLIVSAAGVTVVVPAGFCVSRDLAPLLESRRDWIGRALEKMSERVRQVDSTKGLPSVIDFAAVGEKWRVIVEPLVGERLVAKDGTLVLTSDYRESEALVVLRRWLLLKGRVHLPPLLIDVAKKHALKVAKVSVGEQKSLWGSCSSTGNIRLNSRLLFLPPHLVHHVLLHELCHLQEMNHSKRFHALLESLDPDAQIRERELKRAWSVVPGWVFPPSDVKAR